MRPIQFGLILLLCLNLSGCNRAIDTSGTYVSAQEASGIVLGMDGDAVRARLGAPSYTSALDPDFWAYIGTRLQVRIFQQPQPIERRILALDMSGGVVREIVELSLENGRQIYPNPDRTPTNGRTITLVEELIGNIRRF